MKFSTSGEDLVNSLSKLNIVIPTRSPLPILENILFELNGNNLSLLASDLEIFIRTKMEVSGKEDGKIAIPAKKIIEIARTLEDKNLTIESNEKNRITIKTPNGKYVVTGESADDFPSPEEKTDMEKIELDGHTIKRFISKVIHAVNTDDLRRNMAGIFFDIRSNELICVATDGFRLGKIIKKNFKHDNESESKFTIPLKACTLVLRLNNNDDSTIEFDENDLKISFDKVELYSKLIDETFPNYENVIPDDNDKILKISRDELSNSLKRALFFTDVITKRVKLEMAPDSMTIKSDNPETGSEGEETLECSFVSNVSSGEEKPSAEGEDGGKFTVAFNAGYLLDAVHQMETGEINISFGTPSKAAIATPTEQSSDENYIELIMPVRVG
jgi:DNA polymerase-3 subunit beta